MADNGEYLEDRKFILESLREHKEDIKHIFKAMEEVKISLNTLIIKMAGVTTVTGIIIAWAMDKVLG